MDGLIVVDVQNDFCPGGALAVPEGDAVVEPINRQMDEIPFTVATRDWHPPDHHLFAEQGGPRPVHRVRETGGAQLRPKLHTSELDAVVDKGQGRDDDVYSGFEHSDLERLLREQVVDTVHAFGARLLRRSHCSRRCPRRIRRRLAPRRHPRDRRRGGRRGADA